MRPDRPTADEMLEAVEEFLRDKIMPAVTGHLNFHARVAANVIASVRREIAQSPEIEANQRERLTRLLGHGGDWKRSTASCVRTSVAARHRSTIRPCWSTCAVWRWRIWASTTRNTRPMRG